MAVAPIFPVLLLAVISRCKCDSTISNHNNGNSATQIGELLKPPPPPLTNILPVPFHKGPGRSQRQNLDVGYHYQPPPPPPPPSQSLSSDFKFPSPFYKHYNFNFVPPPQPFTTPPSSLFQKVSGWLFPSQGTGYDAGPYNDNQITQVKKDCNSCNLVPWIPVIRYNLGKSNLQQNALPTYGPPSPTAFANQPPNTAQFYPQHFNSQSQSQFSTGVPHAVYGPPQQSQQSSFKSGPSSTYGPPSATHTVLTSSQKPSISTFSAHTSSFSIPSSSYGVPSTFIGQLSSTYGVPSSSYGVPSSSFNVPSSSYGAPSSSYGVASSTFRFPTSSYATSSPLYGSPTPVTTSLGSETTHISGIINSELHPQNDFDVTDTNTSGDLHLPHVGNPTAFKNSYGEIIGNIYDPTSSFPASAAEASKIKTEIVPLNSTKLPLPNASLALANPAPFTLKGGRNIHTLQPVALPNLSVSPLPPIFNARPFRPLKTLNLLSSDILNKHPTKNTDIKQSIPITQFTHSIDYPPTVIYSPIIDINATRGQNQTKTYRNILNSYVIDNTRDISSQASEDHKTAEKTNQDASFESTGVDASNDLYDTNIPTGFSQIPSNHKPNFADLRGFKDADVDKYRTESNLQYIDSPLLYLKPNAPHKGFGNFVFAMSTPVNDNDYEIYDETPSTPIPPLSTLTSWDESRNDYNEVLSPPPPAAQEEFTQPKIVQIIVPYTTGKQSPQNNVNFEHVPQDWPINSEDEYKARKVPTNTENPYFSTYSDIYATTSPPTEEYLSAVTEQYESERLNTPAILNDLYDVKEPPFDIMKLQHTIDGWTEQEYSLRYKAPHSRNNGKYAKQIPDEYFTTTDPITNYVTANNYNIYDFYDHEGASSMHHAVTDQKNKTNKKAKKEYNAIDRYKNKYQSGKHEESEDKEKLHIYTAASSFRSSTTTPAPWEAIQTSISPLTKEKIYVVTSKPWREILNATKDWYGADKFESKNTDSDNDVSGSDNLPFKSPRFSNRPSLLDGKIDSVKEDSSYGFSRTWFQNINDLERRAERNVTSLPEGDQHQYNILEEDSIITTTTAEPLDEQQYDEERK